MTNRNHESLLRTIAIVTCRWSTMLPWIQLGKTDLHCLVMQPQGNECFDGLHETCWVSFTSVCVVTLVVVFHVWKLMIFQSLVSQQHLNDKLEVILCLHKWTYQSHQSICNQLVDSVTWPVLSEWNVLELDWQVMANCLLNNAKQNILYSSVAR